MALKSKVVTVFDVTKACLQSGYDLSNIEETILSVQRNLLNNKWPEPFSKVRAEIDAIDYSKQGNVKVSVLTLKQKVGGVRIVLVYKFERG